MSEFVEAARRSAAIAVVWACASLGFGLTLPSPAAADDNGEWFGHTFKGTNLGQTAGIMRLGRPHRGDLAGDDGGSRAEGTRRSRRHARGTRVASLGESYAPSIASIREGRRAASHRRSGRRVRLASLGGDFPSKPRLGPSLSGGGLRWAASSGCLNGSLASVVRSVASNFGSVTVNSTCRGRRHNARVGGARHSYHLSGNAVDFRVNGNWRAAYAYLRSSGSVGGLKHYGGGLFHIDTGPRRSW